MSSSQNNHMWFNLCILNELVPPTIDLEETLQLIEYLIYRRSLLIGKRVVFQDTVGVLNVLMCNHMTVLQFIKTVFVDYNKKAFLQQILRRNSWIQA